MKKIFAVTLVAALALFAGSAYANFCARDVVPASTLLVPYVVVGMSGNVPDPAGYTTNAVRDQHLVGSHHHPHRHLGRRCPTASSTSTRSSRATTCGPSTSATC